VNQSSVCAEWLLKFIRFLFNKQLIENVGLAVYLPQETCLLSSLDE